MKKLLTMLLAMTLCAVCAVPASALEYRIDAPPYPIFARPTSDDTIYVTAPVNVDRSKDTAILPPPVALQAYRTAFTEVTDALRYADGSLGMLCIPSIGVCERFYSGTDSAALAKGVGHFPESSIWDGNCCFAGHNRGTNALFGRINILVVGCTMTLTTRLGARTYAVVSVEKVPETDLSVLAATEDNRITLITCVRDEPEYRWCVRAVAV